MPASKLELSEQKKYESSVYTPIYKFTALQIAGQSTYKFFNGLAFTFGIGSLLPPFSIEWLNFSTPAGLLIINMKLDSKLHTLVSYKNPIEYLKSMWVTNNGLDVIGYEFAQSTLQFALSFGTGAALAQALPSVSFGNEVAIAFAGTTISILGTYTIHQLNRCLQRENLPNVIAQITDLFDKDYARLAADKKLYQPIAPLSEDLHGEEISEITIERVPEITSTHLEDIIHIGQYIFKNTLDAFSIAMWWNLLRLVTENVGNENASKTMDELAPFLLSLLVAGKPIFEKMINAPKLETVIEDMPDNSGVVVVSDVEGQLTSRSNGSVDSTQNSVEGLFAVSLRNEAEQAISIESEQTPITDQRNTLKNDLLIMMALVGITTVGYLVYMSVSAFKNDDDPKNVFGYGLNLTKLSKVSVLLALYAVSVSLVFLRELLALSSGQSLLHRRGFFASTASVSDSRNNNNSSDTPSDISRNASDQSSPVYGEGLHDSTSLQTDSQVSDNENSLPKSSDSSPGDSQESRSAPPLSPASDRRNSVPSSDNPRRSMSPS